MSYRVRPRRALSTVASGAAVLALLATAACGTTEEPAAAPVDNIAAGADEAAVTPPPEADEASDAAAEQISPAPGVTPDPVDVPAAYDFAGTTVGGAEFEGAALAGTPTVMWFWAPWCSSCVNQIPAVQALTGEYADAGVDFVGVGSLDDAGAMKGFTDQVGARGMTQLSDPNGLVWRHFGTTAQSTFLVVDGDGETVDTGYLSEGQLNAAIKTALG